MDYLTTCYRRQEEGGCSLLLQQYLCRQTPVCFACLCSAAGGEGRKVCRSMAESLLNWSRKAPWHRAAGHPAPWLERFEYELTDLLGSFGSTGDDGERKLTLFLCIGEEILVLGGGQNLSLLTTSFGRGKTVELPGQFRGCLESGAGLLLATGGFLKNVGEKDLEEALRIREIRTEKQAERHLREIAAPRQPASFCGRAPEPGTAGREKDPGREPVAAILLVGR